MKSLKILTIFLTWIVLLVPQTEARLLGSALRGAAIGGLIGDEDDAKRGAIIGGSIGLIRSASEKSRQEAQKEAYARQEAERQRIAQEQQQAEIEVLKAQQAAQAAAPIAVPGATLVIEIQKSLIRIGFNPGDVDGLASPQTINAVMQYQAKHGLLEDGNLSQTLLSHMLRNGG